MKKLLLVAALTIFIFSCKKDESLTKGEELLNQNGISVTVSPKGFLNFKTKQDIAKFSILISEKTNELLIFQNLKNEGFKAKINNISSKNSNLDEVYNLFFNKDGILEVENTILKITNDNKYLLALLEQNLDEIEFENLVNEDYNIKKMKKINIIREANFNLLNFMQMSRDDESISTLSDATGVPMFGAQTTSYGNVSIGSTHYNGVGSCVQTFCTKKITRHYIMWILVQTDTPVYDNCYDVQVTPPPGGC
jgi:hypothetical protein